MCRLVQILPVRDPLHPARPIALSALSTSHHQQQTTSVTVSIALYFAQASTYPPPPYSLTMFATRRLALARPLTTRRLFHSSAPAYVQVGDKIPDVELMEGSPGNKVSLAKELKGKGLIIGKPNKETRPPKAIAAEKTSPDPTAFRGPCSLFTFMLREPRTGLYKFAQAQGCWLGLCCLWYEAPSEFPTFQSRTPSIWMPLEWLRMRQYALGVLESSDPIRLPYTKIIYLAIS